MRVQKVLPQSVRSGTEEGEEGRNGKYELHGYAMIYDEGCDADALRIWRGTGQEPDRPFQVRRLCMTLVTWGVNRLMKSVVVCRTTIRLALAWATYAHLRRTPRQRA